MAESDPHFGSLRDLLAKPSASRWQRLLTTLASWPDHDDLEARVLPYCLSRLEGWPDTVRRVSIDWLDDIAQDKARPQFALARHMDFNALSGSTTDRDAFWPKALEQPWFEAIREVSLYWSSELKVYALLGSPHAHRWTRLALHSVSLDTDQLALLLESEALPACRYLDITSTAFGVQELDAVTSSPWFMGLKGLTLGWPKPPYDAARLVELLRLLDLDELGLLSMKLHLEHIVRLLGDTSIALRSLDLTYNTLGSGAGEFLAGADCLAGLESLELMAVGLGDQGLEDLVTAPWLPRCQLVDLRQNDLSAASVRALASALRGQTTSLILNENPLGDDGVFALADAEGLAGVRELYLSTTKLTNAACAALSTSPYLRHLELLVLHDNSAITRAGWAMLRQSPHWDNEALILLRSGDDDDDQR